MKTIEKNAVLDATITTLGMSEKEFIAYAQRRMSKKYSCIKSIFPIVYKIGKNEYQILPNFIPACYKQVMGYEIFPRFVIAKECGYGNPLLKPKVGDFEIAVNKMVINGSRASLPPSSLFEKYWTKDLPEKIKQMDKFLVNYKVNKAGINEKWIGFDFLCLEKEQDEYVNWFKTAAGKIVLWDMVAEYQRLGATY